MYYLAFCIVSLPPLYPIQLQNDNCFSLDDSEPHSMSHPPFHRYICSYYNMYVMGSKLLKPKSLQRCNTQTCKFEGLFLLHWTGSMVFIKYFFTKKDTIMHHSMLTLYYYKCKLNAKLRSGLKSTKVLINTYWNF